MVTSCIAPVLMVYERKVQYPPTVPLRPLSDHYLVDVSCLCVIWCQVEYNEYYRNIYSQSGSKSPRRLFLHACHELGIGPEYSLVSHLWSLDPEIDLRYTAVRTSFSLSYISVELTHKDVATCCGWQLLRHGRCAGAGFCRQPPRR
jgi:hypothetical protein